MGGGWDPQVFVFGGLGPPRGWGGGVMRTLKVGGTPKCLGGGCGDS